MIVEDNDGITRKITMCPTRVRINDLEIVDSGFCNNSYRRKIAEALIIRNKRPSLNSQDMSIPLKLTYMCFCINENNRNFLLFLCFTILYISYYNNVKVIF